MRPALLVLALVALAAPIAATGEQAASAKTAGTVLAIEWERKQDFLVRVNADSLRPVSKRLPLGGRAYGWSFSPDGRRLALGVDKAGGVVIVNARRMKRIARIRTWSMGYGAIAWVTPRRILGWEPAGLFLLDPVARKRLPSPESQGEVLFVQRAGNRLVLLAAPVNEVGPAQLAVVAASGDVRTIRLDRIRAGQSMPLETRRGESYWPALVLDPAGQAYVVGAGEGEPVAEIRLDSMSLTYREPRRERSLLARFRNWLEPAAEAKMPLVGSFRRGAWLGDGKIAVWGSDSVPLGSDQVQTTPAGLSVIDTKDWTTRMIDAEAWHAAVAAGALLASYRGGGLTGFDTDGRRRYHLFGRDALGVVGTFEYKAFVAFDRQPLRILDARTGRVLGARRSMPRLLHASFRSW